MVIFIKQTDDDYDLYQTNDDDGDLFKTMLMMMIDDLYKL